MSAYPDLKAIARELGGDLIGAHVSAPGLGHSLRDRSLSISLNPDDPHDVLVHSFAGDDYRPVKDHLRRRGLLHSDPQPQYRMAEASSDGIREPRNATPPKSAALWTETEANLARRGYTIKAVYDYQDSTGDVVGQKMRAEHPTDGKTFRWRHRRNGTLYSGRLEGPCPPYGLIRALEHADEAVWIVEGEKDADRLNDAGLVALSVEQGHETTAADHLLGRTCYVIPDQDQHGEARAKKVLAALAERKIERRLVRLPSMRDKADVSDYLDSGKTASDLIRLVDDAAAADAGDCLLGIFTLLDDIKLDPDEPYLVDKILPKKGIGILYAPTYAGKTFLGIDLGASVARGIPFAGKFDVEQGAVVYCAIENPTSIQRRLFAYKQHNRINGALLAVMKFRLNLGAPDSVTTFIAQLAAFAKRHDTNIALVVVDTLSKGMVGLEENSAKDMSRVVAELERIQEATGGCVLGVHHTGKIRESCARGSSVLEAGADFMLRIDCDEKAGIRKLEVVKQKDGSAFTVATFKLEDVPLGLSTKGKLIASAVVQYGDAAAVATKRPKLPEGEQRIMDVLNNLIIDKHVKVAPPGVEVLEGQLVIEQSKLVEKCHEKYKNDPLAQLTKATRDTYGKQINRMADKCAIGRSGGFVWKINP